MEPTSFHTGPNKSRGQIHGAAAAAAGGDDDTRVDSAFLISTVILKKKKKTHTHMENCIRTEMASAKRDVMLAVMKPLTVDYPH